MGKEKTRECPSCAMEIDKTAKECPICGYEFPKQNPTLTIVALILIVTFVLWLVF